MIKKLLILTLLSSSVYAAQGPSTDVIPNSNCNFGQFVHKDEIKPNIRNKSELNQVLKRQDSVFNKLSDSAKKMFVDSLKFNEKGLTSYNYQVLIDELTENEINLLIREFGFANVGTYLIQSENLGGDFSYSTMGSGEASKIGEKGYSCSSPGTCREEQGAICTRNC
jgi:hypothetical protein